jgi:hypothetical protein
VCALFTTGLAAFAQNWTQTTAPTTNWTSVASSADGSRFVAVVSGGLIYTSTNSGGAWTASAAPSNTWAAVGSSADGRKLMAADRDGGNFISSDSGATWVRSALTNCTGILASSADGSKLVAGCSSIYTSADSGATWRPNDVSILFLEALAASADGSALVALGGYSRIYFSTNFGNTWFWSEALYPDYPFSAVATSADARTIVVATRSGIYGNGWGTIFVSTNSGVNWVRTDVPTQIWISVACSADGTRLLGASAGEQMGGGLIYSSTDSGLTWTSNSVPNLPWSSVATSSDGGKSVAVAAGGGIWTRQATPAPVLSISRSNDGIWLSWTVPSLEFGLEENIGLNSTNWFALTNAATLNYTNLHNHVFQSTFGSSRSYRLKH